MKLPPQLIINPTNDDHFALSTMSCPLASQGDVGPQVAGAGQPKELALGQREPKEAALGQLARG